MVLNFAIVVNYQKQSIVNTDSNGIIITRELLLAILKTKNNIQIIQINVFFNFLINR